MHNGDIKRAAYMLKVAAQYIEENDEEGVVFYDDVECDGACVAEDCRNAAMFIEDSDQLPPPPNS